MSSGWDSVSVGGGYSPPRRASDGAQVRGASASGGPQPPLNGGFTPPGGGNIPVHNVHTFTDSFMNLGSRAIQGDNYQKSPMYERLSKMDAKEVDKHYQQQQDEARMDAITSRASEPAKHTQPKNVNPPSKGDAWGDENDDESSGDDSSGDVSGGGEE